MICFKLTKDILDEIYDELPVQNRDDLIHEELKKLSNAYGKLSSGVEIDYSAPATRFAYVFKYVTSHANMVFQILEENKTLGTCFDNPKLTLTFIGGGPGSDLLGVLKYLDVYQKKPQLMCYLLDRERLWNETWGDVGSKVGQDITLNTNFMPFDIIDVNSWIPFSKYLNADIFTFTYFVSEVFSKRAEAEHFFDHLFKKAKKGAYVLFIDNREHCFYNWFDGFSINHSYNVIGQDELQIKIRDYKEQTVDLGEYIEKFGSPKLQGQIAWRILQKP